MNKKTLVLGASTNPERYAHRAVMALIRNGHEVVPVGLRAGTIEGIQILTEPPQVTDINTVTLYVGPERQDTYYDYILSLHPQRVVFNPGTENPAFAAMLEQHNIETVVGCTLVMLSLKNY